MSEEHERYAKEIEGLKAEIKKGENRLKEAEKKVRHEEKEGKELEKRYAEDLRQGILKGKEDLQEELEKALAQTRKAQELFERLKKEFEALKAEHSANVKELTDELRTTKQASPAWSSRRANSIQSCFAKCTPVQHFAFRTTSRHTLLSVEAQGPPPSHCEHHGISIFTAGVVSCMHIPLPKMLCRCAVMVQFQGPRSCQANKSALKKSEEARKTAEATCEDLKAKSAELHKCQEKRLDQLEKYKKDLTEALAVSGRLKGQVATWTEKSSKMESELKAEKQIAASSKAQLDRKNKAAGRHSLHFLVLQHCFSTFRFILYISAQCISRVPHKTSHSVHILRCAGHFCSRDPTHMFLHVGS